MPQHVDKERLLHPEPRGPGSGPSWQDLRLSQRVLEELVPYIDRADLLHRLHALVADLFPHDAGLVATVSGSDPQRLDVAVSHGFGTDMVLPDPLLPSGLIDPWKLAGGPLHIPDIQATRLHVADLFADEGMRSILSIPLSTTPDGEMAAVVVLAHRQPGAFADVSEARLEHFCQAVAVPLSNASRAAHERQQAHQQLAAAVRLWEMVGAGEDLDAVLPRLLDQALAVGQADAGTVMVTVHESGELYVRASTGMRTRSPADAQLPWNTRLSSPLQAMSGPRFIPHLSGEVRAAAAEGFATYLGLPVRTGREVRARGLLNLYWRTPDDAPAADQWALLESIAGAIGAALLLAELSDQDAACARVSEQFTEHKARMLSLIGHQLRTPITSIKGFAQLLLRRVEDPKSSTARYAETILDESKRLGVLVDNVIELSRLEGALIAMQTRPFNLHALLQDLRGDVSLRAVAAPERLLWDVPASLPIVVGDPLRVKQALVALLRRARARSPQESSELSLQARPGTIAGQPAVEILIGSGERAGAVANIEDLLTIIDLRNVVDNQNAQEDELALYSAMQLLQAMRASLRLEGDGSGRTRYVVSLPAVVEQ